MPYIRYEYDPNDPNSKEDARSQAYFEYLIGLVVFWGSIGSIIYFISSVVSLCKGDYSHNIFYSTGLISLMAVVDYFFIFSKVSAEVRKGAAKKYFLFFIGGTLDLSGIIAVIVSIYSLCHAGSGATLLICAIIAVVLITITIICLYRKIEGYEHASVKLFTPKSTSSALFNADINTKNSHTIAMSSKTVEEIFCHKCGKCLPSDSDFCSLCGTKLR